MKHKNLKAFLFTSALAIAAFGTTLPASGSEPVPSEPTGSQAPSETASPADGCDIKHLSDLEIKHTT